MVALKAILVVFALTSSQITFAKLFTDNAQCYIQVHDASIAPENIPERTFGSASAKTQGDACVEAKRVATQKAPRGTYARHCICDSEKNAKKKPTKKK